MRVPDLDWPADLFADVVIPAADLERQIEAVWRAGTSLRRDMFNAWTGRDVLAELGRRETVPRREETVL